MLIAQITDLHLGFEPDNPHEGNRRRLDRTLRDLVDGPNRPDLLIVTGDLTEHGDDVSYRRCAEALAACPFPIHLGVGNHDDRAAFARTFDHPLNGGFAQYVVMRPGLRIVMIDTLEPGRQGGAFCEARAAWLKATLDEDRATPTIIAMHHPPFDAGIAWMATNPHEPWAVRFAGAIAGHDQVRAILCGHLHRAVTTHWLGTSLIVCPSVAAQLALDLSPIDPDRPDGRAMIIADPPGYALHRWHNGNLVTLFETAEDHQVLARFDTTFQPIVRQIRDEAPS